MTTLQNNVMTLAPLPTLTASNGQADICIATDPQSDEAVVTALALWVAASTRIKAGGEWGSTASRETILAETRALMAESYPHDPGIWALAGVYLASHPTPVEVFRRVATAAQAHSMSKHLEAGMLDRTAVESFVGSSAK